MTNEADNQNQRSDRFSKPMASRIACLVDGENYFNIFREAVKLAKRRIVIVGWDMYSRMSLVKDNPDDGYPVEFRALLNHAAKETPELEIFLLAWDYSVIYTLEREILPSYYFDWSTHERVHFKLDNQHPAEGSQHQKIVVIDNQLAFVGGLDITINRWDTRSHQPDDPRRKSPGGKPYAPFHDIQIALEGEAAASLGRVVSDRWEMVTGTPLAPIEEQTSPWPDGLEADFVNTPVCIARTLPIYKTQEEIREIEATYLSQIRNAKRLIYIENQYLTSHVIRDALAERLKSTPELEILIVTPRENSGWMEQMTMGVLRAQFVETLRGVENEQGKQLEIVYPAFIEQEQETTIKVHSKLMIVDDTILRIGSANLSNRSMGTDSECDIIIESTGQHDCSATIRRFRHGLLAEHLGVTSEEVRREEEAKGNVLSAVEALNGKSNRKFMPFDPEETVEASALLDVETIFADPERPLDFDDWVSRYVPSQAVEKGIHPLWRFVPVFLVLTILAIIWNWTPTKEYVNPQMIASAIESIQGSLLAAVAAFFIFVLGSLIMTPITLLILVNGLVFGFVSGVLLSLSGALVSATLGYLFGRWLYPQSALKRTSERLYGLSRKLSKASMPTIIFVRLFPVAPFTMINLLSGSMHLNFKTYIIATGIATLPGIFGLTIFGESVSAVLKKPDIQTISIALGILILLIAASLFFFRRSKLAKLRQNREAPKVK